jgi:membrane fusion protein YbhG
MKKTKLFAFSFMVFIIAGCNSNESDDYIEESGNIETTNIILSSQVAGQVEKVLSTEGDQVKMGDTLLIIDHDILQIKLKQTHAGENASRAQLDLAVTGARNEDIILAQEQHNQASSNYELANLDFERMKNLFAEQAITKKQHDDAETRFTIAKSKLSAAKENLKKIKNISRPEEIAQKRANYENAQANVELIKKQISDSHITAPIDGFIVERFVELGESVNYGSSIFKVADLSIVELIVYVNEENLGKVKLGQTVDISTDSYKDKVYEGNVVFISPEAEFTPKNIQTKDERTKLVFAVKVDVPNPEFELKAGMPADAKIRLKD